MKKRRETYFYNQWHYFGDSKNSKLALVDFELQSWVKLHSLTWRHPAVKMKYFSLILDGYMVRYKNANFTP